MQWQSGQDFFLSRWDALSSQRRNGMLPRRFLPHGGIGFCMTRLPPIVANLIERFESPAISILHALTFVDRIVESAETLLKAPHIDRMVPELKRVHLRDRSSGGTSLSIISERRCSLRFQSCTVREVSLHSTAARIGILVAMRSLLKATGKFFYATSGSPRDPVKA